jgi:ubiquinone/menaquinone biosynthesis C-methylase UbiE
MAREKPDFSTQVYWDEAYAKKDGLFDWLEDYNELKTYIAGHLSRDHRILVPGCGNSAMSGQMYDDGYQNISNVDFSPVVIANMSARHITQQMTWEVMDIKAMTFSDDTFDSILDKGTIDALTCGGDVDENIHRACSEYTRVLKPGGIAFIISFGQPADREEYFNPAREHAWIYDGFDILPREVAPHTHFHVFRLRKPDSSGS